MWSRKVNIVVLLVYITAAAAVGWSLLKPGLDLGAVLDDYDYAYRAEMLIEGQYVDRLPNGRIERNMANVKASAVSTIILCALLAIAVRKWKASSRGWLPSAFLFQLALYSLFTFLLAYNTDPEKSAALAKTARAGATLGFATFLHTVLVRLGPPAFAARRESLLYWLYLPAVVFLCLLPTPHLIAAVSHSPVGAVAVAGPAHTTYSIFLWFYFTLAVLTILHKCVEAEGVVRTRAALLGVAFLPPVLALSAATALLPPDRFAIPMEAAGLCCCAIIATYALLRKRPVDLPRLVVELVLGGRRRFNKRLYETVERLTESEITRGDIEEALTRLLGCDAAIETVEKGRWKVEAHAGEKKPPANNVMAPGASDRWIRHGRDAGLENAVHIDLDSTTMCVVTLGPGVKTYVFSKQDNKNLNALWRAVRTGLLFIMKEEKARCNLRIIEQKSARVAQLKVQLEKSTTSHDDRRQRLEDEAAEANRTSASILMALAIRFKAEEDEKAGMVEEQTAEIERAELALEEKSLLLEEKEAAIKELGEALCLVENTMGEPRLELTREFVNLKDEIKTLAAEVEEHKRARESAEEEISRLEADAEKSGNMIKQFKKEKRKLRRQNLGLKIDYLSTRRAEKDVLPDKKRIRVLLMGVKPKFDLKRIPSVEPIAAETWEKAVGLIKKKEVDVMVLHRDMYTVISKKKLPSSEVPVLVSTYKPEIRKKFAALFPMALTSFIPPNIKDENLFTGTVRIITAVVSATLYKDAEHRLISAHRPFISLVETLKGIAKKGRVIFLQGDSGTGKEALARLINEHGPPGPFVTLNCAEPDRQMFAALLFGSDKGSYTGSYENRVGAIERAADGTVFLDEFAEMPKALQAKLLRVVEGYAFWKVGGKTQVTPDVLIVCATSRNILDETVMREDMRFRFGLHYYNIPPLSKRKEDIPLLIYNFLIEANDEYDKSCQVSEVLVESLKNYSWPGNVRYLRNLIHRAVSDAREKNALIKYVDKAHKELTNPLSLLKKAEAFKMKEVNDALSVAAYVPQKAAEILGIRRQNVIKWMKKMEKAGYVWTGKGR